MAICLSVRLGFTFLVLAPSALAQVNVFANRAWADTLGGKGEDRVQGLAAAADGGMFVAGPSTSFGRGGEDLWIARLDRRGARIWELALGTAQHEDGRAVAATPDGGCLVAGSVVPQPGAADTDGWVVKLDAAGGIEWQRSFASADFDELHAIALSPDGYYLGGTVQDQRGDFDAWVLEVDASGTVLWQQLFAAEGADFLAALAATEDGLGVAINSSSDLGTGGAPFARPWLVRLDGDGQVLWQKAYSFSGGDLWNQLVALEDGGFLAVGEVLFAAFFQGDAWAVRLDSTGDVLWDRRMGDSAGNLGFDGAVGARATADGGFAVLAGTSTAKGGLWVFRLDGGGELLWNRSYGGTLSVNATAFDQAPNGDLLLAGSFFDPSTNDTDSLVVRLLPSGRGPSTCQLGSTPTPNLWTGPLPASDVTVPPTVATHVASDTSSTPSSVATVETLCAPFGGLEEQSFR